MSNTKLALFFLGLTLASPNIAASSDWKWKGELEASLRYDSNIFRLSPSQVTALETPSAADAANGRFLDMKSPDDVIFSPVFSLALEGPGVRGKDLEIKGRAGGDVYWASQRRSNFE